MIVNRRRCSLPLVYLIEAKSAVCSLCVCLGQAMAVNVVVAPMVPPGGHGEEESA